ncbi:hypothetical protein ACQPYK_43695 [Streptosporangium sp. CA-135522]|uniref:hypothetical protein n=1 Tax=Streptosporangium sp. CA-135522 TaxID=3240072 RepID=UPI003D93FD2D
MMKKSTIVLLLALTACSSPAEDPILKDPASWPLATLKAVRTKGDLDEKADKALARIQVGSHDLAPWINAKGTCGLTDHGSGEEWSLSIGLDQSSGASTSGEEGFAGQVEPAALASWDSTVYLICTPTRMMVKVKTRETKVELSGSASAQVGNGLVAVVIGTPEARKESLPQATVTGK